MLVGHTRSSRQLLSLYNSTRRGTTRTIPFIYDARHTAAAAGIPPLAPNRHLQTTANASSDTPVGGTHSVASRHLPLPGKIFPPSHTFARTCSCVAFTPSTSSLTRGMRCHRPLLGEGWMETQLGRGKALRGQEVVERRDEKGRPHCMQKQTVSYNMWVGRYRQVGIDNVATTIWTGNVLWEDKRPMLYWDEPDGRWGYQ
ncbi:hypothetical protein C8F01DRAFT_509001 [Mycena amicta]|nr:hypothetical protein C8F01DRAFT_509001 [Mycena amicta]